MRRPGSPTTPAAALLLVVLLVTGCGAGHHPAGPAAAPGGTAAAPGGPPAPPGGPGAPAQSPMPTPSPVPPEFYPASASFPDAAHGFALGLAPCGRDGGQGLCTALAASDSGGAHWQARAAPQLVPTDPFRRAELAFADPMDGFAALGALQSTHDGARSWQPVPLPGLADPQVVALAAGGGFVYVVAGEGRPGGGLTGGPLQLFAGAAQVDAFVAVPGVALPAAGAGLHFGLGGGGAFLAVDPLAGPPQLLVATDPAHWAALRSPCPAGSGSAVGAADLVHLAVVCDANVGPLGADKVVWLSADGGRSFRPAGGPGPVGFTAAAGEPDPRTVVVAATARDDRLYRSGDGGQSFEVVYASNGDASGGGLGFADLSFADATHGSVVLGDAGVFARERARGRMAVAAPRLLTTADGGQHWTQTVIRR